MKIKEEKVWWEFTCIACGSVCEAEPDDAAYRSNIDYEGAYQMFKG